VVLPVRNGGRWLREAVDSMLCQTLPALELLVVDDHSDDGAVAALGRDDSRLRLLQSAGRGVGQAFNTGLAASSAPFVARMDADDLALPERLERQLAYLETRPEVDICGACVEIFRDDGAPLAGGNRRYQAWLNACRDPADIRRELFVESPLPNPTAMFPWSAWTVMQIHPGPRITTCSCGPTPWGCGWANRMACCCAGAITSAA
jgi:glycosyltransferase involved in cell wall biosynthesis